MIFLIVEVKILEMLLKLMVLAEMRLCFKEACLVTAGFDIETQRLGVDDESWEELR